MWLYALFFLHFSALAEDDAKPIIEVESSAPALHEEGGVSGGGGDPLATQFVRIAREVQIAAESRAITKFPDARELSRLVGEIERSLEGHAPRLQFHNGLTVDCFGTPKLACVGEDGIIRLARQGWESASAEIRVEVTAMELIMARGGRKRYNLGPEIVPVVLASRQENADSVLGPFQAAEKLFSSSSVESTELLLGHNWICDSFMSGRSHSQFSAERRFARDPLDASVVVDTVNSKSGTDDRLRYTTQGEGGLANLSGDTTIRFTAKGNLVVRIRQGTSPRASLTCTANCSTQTSEPLSVIGDLSQSVAPSDTYQICHRGR